MAPTQPAATAQNILAPFSWSTAWRLAAAMLLGASVLSLVAAWLGLDQALAVATYNPHSFWGKFIRDQGALPALAVTVLALGALLPPVARRWPQLKQLAIVWILNLALGAGFATNMVLKEQLQRPRPRETVLLGGQYEFRPVFSMPRGEGGKSFPSGHATMGFIFASLAFPLWRQRRKAAWASLGIGLLAGGFIGWGRMVAGAHFATDNLFSGAIILATAALVTPLAARRWDWRQKAILTAALGLCLIAALLVTPVERTVRLPAAQLAGVTQLRMTLPCRQTVVMNGPSWAVSAAVTGFGGPAGTIRIRRQADTSLSLAYAGIFREIACTAYVTVPPQGIVQLPRSMAFVASGVVTEPHPTDTHWRTFKPLAAIAPQKNVAE